MEYYKLNHILVIGIYYDELDFIIGIVDIRLLEMKFSKKGEKNNYVLGI